jgi:membrane-associated phospholipid phosphatase
LRYIEDLFLFTPNSNDFQKTGRKNVAVSFMFNQLHPCAVDVLVRFRRLDGRRWLILLVLISGCALAPLAGAQDPTSTDDPEPKKPVQKTSTIVPPPSFKRFHIVLGKNLTSNLFSRGNLAPFLIGSAVALAISPADQGIVDALHGKSPTAGKIGNVLGGPALVSAVSAGLLIATAKSSNPHFRTFTFTFVQAVVVDNLLTEALKVSVNRTRPNGEKYSFPSGHTSNSFAAATVVSHYYGRKWGIPLYVLSGLVGVSRIEQGKHWPSDTVAGAALGIISGLTAIRGTRREMESGTSKQTMLLPFWNHESRGVQIRIAF